ncbi:MAG: hypothetical protein WBA57_15250 [Elainellaceae cyanobacterium]
MGLSEKIQDQQTREGVVADSVKLIDQQVSAKKGMGGMAMKAAYGTVKGIGAGYISGAVERLLPEVVSAIEPMWTEGLEAGDPVAHLTQNQSQAADCVLSVTDTRAAKTSNGVIRSVYGKFRKSVKGDVESAVPGLAQIISQHLQ